MKHQSIYFVIIFSSFLLYISTNANAQSNDRIETVGDDLCNYI